MSELNEKQKQAFNLILQGKNVLISGPGGVGKSFLTRHVLEKFEDSTVLVAPTGIAALNIGGATIHSTFKLPTSVITSYHHKNIADSTQGLFSKEGPVKRIIIDEQSMVRADAFIAMDMKLRYIRRTNKPFGGIQVICVGDFFQLPPVLTDRESEKFKEIAKSPFSFCTESWSACGFEYIELDQVMRQSDAQFIENLQTIRWGDDKKLGNAIKFFNDLSSANEDGIYDLDPVFLCTTNKNAEFINASHYEELDGEEKTFYAAFDNNVSVEPAPKVLDLKFGTKVMFLANTDQFKNGELGYVTGFVGKFIEVTKDNEREDVVLVDQYEWIEQEYENNSGELKLKQVGKYKQYPLKHAWAVTIHKSQGLTLPSAVINFGNGCFTSGQAYVALSRVKNLNGLYLTRKLSKRDIIVAPEVKDFYNSGAAGASLF